MARTFKDKPYYHTERYHEHEAGQTASKTWIAVNKSNFKKKPRNKDTEHHWMTTPSWWVREFMNQPARARANRLTKATLRLDDLELADVPNTGRKPHVYYW